MKIINIGLSVIFSILLSSCSTSKTVVLQEDISLSENYPFQGDPQIVGSAKAGTIIEIDMTKGSVAYITIRTVIDKSELEKSSIKE